MLREYANTNVIKQEFRFLEEIYNLKIINESNLNYGAYLDYVGNGIKISLGFDYKDYFFYFYIFKGENTKYTDQDDANQKTFYDLALKENKNFDFTSLQPNNEGYLDALKNNASILQKYGKNILTGKEWF
jgi:hypothetical protein